MSVLDIVLPLAILIAIGFGIAFAWRAKSGQFDDVDTPGVRILFEDEDRPARPKGDQPD